MSSCANVQLDSVTLEFPVSRGKRARSLKAMLRQIGDGGGIASHSGQERVVRALENVSFKAHPGDRVGIVGANGAGKSTLLRVMANTYEPTRGRVLRRGRVAAPLGLDSSPGEDSGYDRVMHLGLVFGLKPQDVAGYLAEIAALSGLGDNLALPVNSYSDGMKARLTFAMHACLKPDILLIDEWISATDREFIETLEQCAQQMADGGRILVLASHDFDLLERLCTTGVLLDAGRVVACGPIRDVLRERRPAAG